VIAPAGECAHAISASIKDEVSLRVGTYDLRTVLDVPDGVDVRPTVFPC